MSDLLPPNRSALELAVSEATAFELAASPIATLWHPTTCPATHLPWLAWALSVDEWDEAWSEATQRAVIAASIDIHRKKGTVGAVRAALASLGLGSSLIEWWQESPRTTPHTFRVVVEVPESGYDLRHLAKVERIVAPVKPARAHLTAVGASMSRSAGLPRYAGAIVGAETTTLYPGSP